VEAKQTKRYLAQNRVSPPARVRGPPLKNQSVNDEMLHNADRPMKCSATREHAMNTTHSPIYPLIAAAVAATLLAAALTPHSPLARRHSTRLTALQADPHRQPRATGR
jgi:hypothetical protein